MWCDSHSRLNSDDRLRIPQSLRFSLIYQPDLYCRWPIFFLLQLRCRRSLPSVHAAEWAHSTRVYIRASVRLFEDQAAECAHWTRVVLMDWWCHGGTNWNPFFIPVIILHLVIMTINRSVTVSTMSFFTTSIRCLHADASDTVGGCGLWQLMRHSSLIPC
jgi:hypothetical protein